MRKRLAFIFFILILPPFLYAQNDARIVEQTLEIPTYPYSDPNPVATLTSSSKFIYPYHSFDGYSFTAVNKRWKAIKMENDYIELIILPELGGKVWGAVEKSTGREFVYQNNVVKFRNVALRGPWSSGGIEYNFGIIGHSPSTAAPVDYVTRKNDDGSVSCIVGTMDLPSRTHWRVEIRLPKDKSYFETIPVWYNPTPLPQSYYCFLTGAAAVVNDMEFYYPGNQALEHQGQVAPWPIQQGHDKSKYSGNAYDSHTSIHIVGEYNDFMGGYSPSLRFGFGHWALYDEMPGRKLWLWASSREGEIWKDLLTDGHGQYMEFQAGRSFNQYLQSAFRSPIKELGFSPGLTDSWREIWFPVKDIGGMSDVSPMGVLNVDIQNDTLTFGVNALASVNARIVVTSEGAILYSTEKQFKPMDVFSGTVVMNGKQNYLVTVEGMDLRFGNSPDRSLKRPFETHIGPDSSSASGLFQEAVERKEKRNYHGAKELFLDCLQRDSLFIDAMTGLSELYYRSRLYDSAVYFSRRALQLDTYCPAANYFLGLSYFATNDLVNAIECLGWAARSPEFRSAAFSQMAAVCLTKKDYALAEYYANKSLDFNRQAFNSLYVLAITYRKTGESEKARGICRQIETADPLNQFVLFERYLRGVSAGENDIFGNSVRNEFPYQTFIEIALIYSGLGQNEEAAILLGKAPRHPLVSIWRAFLTGDKSLLEEAAGMPASFVFPYRSETAAALEWAVANDKSWKFRYYLGLNYWALDRPEDALRLLASCAAEPDLAAFYQARAALGRYSSQEEKMADYRHALRLDSADWRNWRALIDVYASQDGHADALAVSSIAYARFPGNYNIALQHAERQLNSGHYEACLSTLRKTTILPFEGSVQGKFVFEQAHLLLALAEIDKRRYKRAMVQIEKSRAWPENLGVGKPYEPDDRFQDYLLALCLDHLGKTEKARALREEIVQYSNIHYGGYRRSFSNLLGFRVLAHLSDTSRARLLKDKIQGIPGYRRDPVHRWVLSNFRQGSGTEGDPDHSVRSHIYYRMIRLLNEIENGQR